MEYYRCLRIVRCSPLCQTDRSNVDGTNQGKMERHFPNKPEWLELFSISFPIPHLRKIYQKGPGQWICLSNWNGKFRSERSDVSKWTAPGVVPNSPVGSNETNLYIQLTFRSYWHNGKQPWSAERAETRNFDSKFLNQTERSMMTIHLSENFRRTRHSRIGW